MEFGTNNVRTENLYLYSDSDLTAAEPTVMYDLGTGRVTGKNTNPKLVGRSTFKNVVIKSEATAAKFTVESVEIEGVTHYYWDKPGI